MGRQRRSPLEELILVASRLPWWASIVLALISYVILHLFASRPAPHVTTPGQMGNAAVTGMITTLALFGQYLLPFCFGIAAVVSIIMSQRQRGVYEKVVCRSDVAALHDLGWNDFERLVGEYHRRQGFSVRREGGNGPDGGVDLILHKDGETYFVQCKQWKAYKVGVIPVREFYGVMAAHGAAGGYFVTSGIFTDDARAFAQDTNLTLIDGHRLRMMIDIARTPAVNTPATLSRTPQCPACGADMTMRIARQGKHAGTSFWGCTRFPQCRGIRPTHMSGRVGYATAKS